MLASILVNLGLHCIDTNLGHTPLLIINEMTIKLSYSYQIIITQSIDYQ